MERLEDQVGRKKLLIRAEKQQEKSLTPEQGSEICFSSVSSDTCKLFENSRLQTWRN